MHSLVVSIVLVLMVALQAQAIQFVNCKSKAAMITQVDVTGCGTDEELCTLKSGSTVIITVHFGSLEDADVVNATIVGDYDDDKFRWKDQSNQLCQNSFQCPIQKGSSYVAKLNFEVKKDYHEGRLDIQVKLSTENTKHMGCVLFEAKIDN